LTEGIAVDEVVADEAEEVAEDVVVPLAADESIAIVGVIEEKVVGAGLIVQETAEETAGTGSAAEETVEEMAGAGPAAEERVEGLAGACSAGEEMVD
jgi:hypothetical protein